MGTGTYLLDKEHLPIYPDFEDNTMVMDENEPSYVHAQAKKEKAKAKKAARMPTTEEASQYLLKSKQDQLGYLIASTMRIHLLGEFRIDAKVMRDDPRGHRRRDSRWGGHNEAAKPESLSYSQCSPRSDVVLDNETGHRAFAATA